MKRLLFPVLFALALAPFAAGENPALPVTRINRIAPPSGLGMTEIDGGMFFKNSSDRIAFANELATGVGAVAAKASVVAATVANGTLATAFAAGSVIDGVTLATGDRILLRAQSAPAENGIYVVAASSVPSRAGDFDAWSEIPGTTVAVQKGSVNADTFWLSTADDGGTLGATAITFAAIGGGSVTSVGMSVPNWLSIGGQPITASGTLALGVVSQAQGLFLASPSGAAGVLAPRAIVAGDLPDLSASYVPLTAAARGLLPDGTSVAYPPSASTDAARGAAAQAAKSATASGGTIAISPGTFATFNLLKTGVGWSAPPGSTFSYTGTTPHILFDDSATGANGAVVSAITADKIIAHGTQSTGQTYHDGFAVTVDNAASNVRIVADEIYGGTTAAGIDEGCAIRQSGGYLDIVAKKITGPQGSIYWRNGECHIRAGLISGTVWNDMATTPTGALWVDADLIVEPAADSTGAVYCGGSQPTAQVWVRAKEIRSAYTGILCGGGKNYIDTLKLTYTGVGNSAIFLSGVSKSWVTAQKISGAVLQVGAVGATLDLSTQEWLDDTGDTGNFILMAANSEVHIHGGYFKAVSCAGISAADGSLRVSDATIDMSAVAGSNPVALSGGMVILQNTTLIARAGQASIVSDGNPRTIYCYHCVANTAPDANVTVLPPGGLTISANVQ